jgi:hypothetical protein
VYCRKELDGEGTVGREERKCQEKSRSPMPVTFEFELEIDLSPLRATFYVHITVDTSPQHQIQS